MKVRLQLGELSAEFEGEWEEIKGAVNDFLSNVRKMGESGFRPIQTNIQRKTFGGSLTARIEELVNEGFLNKPKSLSEIQRKLTELGYHYPVTTISPTLLQIVRQRKLRRMGYQGSYQYVKP